jgi:hypothetical protein
MSLTKLLLEYAMVVNATCAWALFAVLFWKRHARSFSFLAAFMVSVSLDVTARTLLLFFRSHLGLSPNTAFALYFYNCWALGFVEHALMFCIIYQIFRQAMTPFKGLRRLGTMLFKWVCSVAVLVTVCIVVVPGYITVQRYLSIIVQFEQTIGILTICLLLFVCFAIRHLGMTYRSHLFGASLGLGMTGAISLVATWWTSAHGTPSLYSQQYIVTSIFSTLTIMVWGGYFVWNQISAALGDDPGVVAVSGFTPDSLSPAERLVLGASARREDPRSVKVRVPIPEQAIATGTQR